VLEENVRLVLDRIRPDDVVLDIGGWARPFNRADWVLDAMPYETRGFYGPASPAQGGAHEHFTRDRWIQRDVCSREPFPFADKAIDFVACSHTLEDLRDPLWVCSEMVRVAKRGYLEVPSRIAESSRGIEPGIVGWSHHRWLIDIADEAIVFRMKYHTIHAHWRFSLPAEFVRGLPERRHVQWLLWEDRFEFREATVHGVDQIAEDLEQFVTRTHPYPRWLVRAAGAGSALGATCGRVYRGVRRRVRAPGVG
jgi:hypothetical protein